MITVVNTGLVGQTDCFMFLFRRLYFHIPRLYFSRLRYNNKVYRLPTAFDLPVRKDNRRIAGNGWFPEVSTMSN